MTQRIGIMGDALAPDFNEAFANQMRLLSQAMSAPVLTGNNIGLAPFRKAGQYLIVNLRFLRGSNRIPLLSLANGAFFYPFLKSFERRFDTILLTGGINSRFLPYVDLRKCLLVMNSMPFSTGEEALKTFASRFAPGLRGIIAQSRRIRDELVGAGVNAQKVHTMYPWIDLNQFKYASPPDAGEFRILFASAPNQEDPSGNIFESKGLSLLLETFKEFTRSGRATLSLIWRGHCRRPLHDKIEALDLAGRVTVVDQVADMPRLYSQSHITVIPFLDTRWSPEIPLSAVESLACGRPVVTTSVLELADIIKKYNCGCVVNPAREQLLAGLVECRANYSLYQKNCRRAAEELFGLRVESLRAILEGRWKG